MDNPPGKTAGIIAYLTFIGLIIAFYMNQEKKHPFATWHIKNMFGVQLGFVVAFYTRDTPFGFYIYWTVVCLWLLCLIMAILGKQQGIPYLSDKFQVWFKFLG